MKLLSPDDARTRNLANTRLAASTSFSEKEIGVLDEIVMKLLRGADMRAMARSPEVASIARKVVNMKATLRRQRERRAAIGGGHG